jgi:hypothetical protein
MHSAALVSVYCLSPLVSLLIFLVRLSAVVTHRYESIADGECAQSIGQARILKAEHETGRVYYAAVGISILSDASGLATDLLCSFEHADKIDMDRLRMVSALNL